MYNTSSENLQIFKGSTLGRCHKVEAFLGEGGFGFVTKCRNIDTDRVVAIKVNKNHPEIVQQAREEIAILKSLKCLDPDTSNIVRWNGFFFDKDHICLNFELLDQSLYDYMEERHHQGLSIQELSPVVHQLATALSHLRSMSIIHADLKPDNIMVVNRHQQPLKVKIIDFGLACHASAAEPGVCLQTIWYRAPEIILQTPFNEAIDMWSLGLVAAELATGYPLYPGDTDYEMLSFIMQAQGQPEDHVLDRGRGTDYYFYKKPNSQRMWTFKTPEEFSYETGMYTGEPRYLELSSLDDLEQIMVMNRGPQRDQRLLLDLVKKMLQLDADMRIKPLEVLQHPLFNHTDHQISRPNTFTIMDTEEDEPQVNWQSSSFQTSGPGRHLKHCRTTTVTASRAPGTALTQNDPAKMEVNDLEEAVVQPDTARNDRWFRRLFRWITGPFRRFFSGDGEDNNFNS
eukprot:superscaffoldBa00000811_g7377